MLWITRYLHLHPHPHPHPHPHVYVYVDVYLKTAYSLSIVYKGLHVDDIKNQLLMSSTTSKNQYFFRPKKTVIYVYVLVFEDSKLSFHMSGVVCFMCLMI